MLSSSIDALKVASTSMKSDFAMMLAMRGLMQRAQVKSFPTL